jgi:hypothetical protein
MKEPHFKNYLDHLLSSEHRVRNSQFLDRCAEDTADTKFRKAWDAKIAAGAVGRELRPEDFPPSKLK